MKFTKRIFAVLASAVMAVSVLAIGTSAESIEDTAKEIKNGVKTSTIIPAYDSADYKIVLSKKGTVTANIDISNSITVVYLYDSDGNCLMPNDISLKTGSYKTKSDYVVLYWSDTLEKSSGTVTYNDISAGTYYLRIERDLKSGSGKLTLTVKYPSKDDENGGKISYLTLKMYKGDSIKLGAVVEPSDAEIKWTSSKTDIASVSSSGKVTAKKVGKTLITAKCGKSTAKIMIIVEDDD